MTERFYSWHMNEFGYVDLNEKMCKERYDTWCECWEMIRSSF